MKYFIANWKAHKDLNEVLAWWQTFSDLLKNGQNSEAEIIICPPFPLILSLKEKVAGFKNVHLGAQNISQFDEGPYTGEVGGKNLVNLAEYVIVGHSERRRNFGETDEMLARKTNLALKYNLKPIFCLENESQTIPPGVNMVAYEPVGAIGTGKNEPLEKVLAMKKRLPLNPTIPFIYGGSVDEKNISYYLASSEINGFLIATASLDPTRFYKIVSLA